MKRFTETEKWRDPWFRALSAPAKLVFFYVLDHCNNAGFYEMDRELMVILTGMKAEQVDGALKGLKRGLIEADGWVWVRRFLRHQKNDELNSENPAHKQIISLIKDQLLRFAAIPEFQQFTGPFKGLLSPIGIGTVLVKVKKERGFFKKPSLEDCLSYATEINFNQEDARGWYDHFESNGWRVSGRASMTDWKAAMRNGKRRNFSGEKPKKEFKMV